MPDRPPDPSNRSTDDDPAGRLWGLWRQGQRPDVDAFLSRAGRLSLTRVGEVLRVDQRERWEAGDPVPAEAYLDRHPTLRADPEAVLDVVFNEFLVRERLGQRPDPEEYRRRFPELATALSDQIALHRAMSEGPFASGTDPSGPGLPSRPTGPTRLRPGDIPRTFGRYRILGPLGQGGMGRVYLAHDTRLDRQVALKVPNLGENAPAETVERFYREARVAAAFTHPNLCPVYDVGEVNGTHYLTMPLLRGETLLARLRRGGRLPQTEAARLAAAVADALRAAHEAGVVHRDLKPANVMLGERGVPVVMDFGLARRHGPSDARITATGTALGTPAYAPPEQIGGDPAAVGPACDVYSLGVILYELLTGRLPFLGPVHEVLQQVLVSTPSPPSDHRPDLDRRLEAVCLRAMAKDPGQRFASMAEFAAALRPFAADGGTTAVKDVPVRPSALAVGPRTAGLLSAGAGALLIALLLVWQPWAAGPGPGSDRDTPRDPPDLLQAGSEWQGSYRFLGDNGSTGDVSLTVTERDGPDFRGIYSTLKGEYKWEVKGTVRGEEVRWELTKAIKEKQPTGAAGTAKVEGTYVGGVMEVQYTDHDSSAKMTLSLRK